MAQRAFSPDWVDPPGEALARLLQKRGMSQAKLADRLGVSPKHVNRVVKGAASISAEMSLGLEKVLGLPADYWIAREAQYQADRARQEERLALRSSEEWAAQFPLNELRSRKWIDRDVDGPLVVEQLLRFLGIAHPSQWNGPEVAYRKSAKFQSDDFALSAWLREGELAALDIDCAPYDEDRFVEELHAIRALSQLEPEIWWPELQSRCASCGVAVVAVPTFKQARSNGAARWLSSDKALIQLSLRHKWEDIFWFSFFHEAGHIVLHRRKEEYNDLFVERSGPAPTEEARKAEREADRFAARTLIPSAMDRRLKSLRLDEVVDFAARLGIAPAIVVGRMQHEGVIRYSQGNDLRRRLEFAED